MPISSLRESPIIRVQTWRGAFFAYKVEIARDDGRRIAYYHRETGILLLLIGISNPLASPLCSSSSCRDVSWIVLYDTNIEELRPILIKREQVILGDKLLSITIETTSTSIADFTFNKATREIGFTVIGQPSTRGLCNITIPRELVVDKSYIRVYFDGSPISFDLAENSTHYFIYFEYDHSMHTIVIALSQESTSSETRPATISTVEIAVIVAVLVIVGIGLTILKKEIVLD